MKTISIVLASSEAFRNTGMFSVDLAAYYFFTTNFSNCEIKFYVFHLSPESDYPYEALVPYSTYNKIDPENVNDLHSSDLIVYWSDFFHTRHFLEQYMENYVFSKSSDYEADLDLFYKAFFLEGADESVFNKTIAFGNSMMFLDPAERSNYDRYAFNLWDLYQQIRMSAPRDTVSHKNVMELLRKSVVQGCDPAFLLPTFQQAPKTNKLGLFIGRRTNIKLMDIFNVVRFANKNDLEIEWIDWMRNTESFFLRAIRHPSQAKNLLLHCTLKLFFGKKKVHCYENDLTTLSRFTMVVTDTYHLAINSVKDGVSTFCISDTSNERGGQLDLHDKKKQVLFEMIGDPQSCGKPTQESLKAACFFLNSYYSTIIVPSVRNALIDACGLILRDK